jgi:hypothetical protein
MRSMLNKKYFSMLALISMSMGTLSWGQGPGQVSRGWGGQGGQHFGGQNGVIRIGTPVFSTGCGQQYPLPSQSPLLQACVAGGAAGMQIAQRSATQQGRIDGFKSGYAWGIRTSIDATRNDPTQIAAGQASLNANDAPVAIQGLTRADTAGATAGAAAGTPNGDQEAVTRFHNAIDTGSMPSNALGQADFARYNPSYVSPFQNPAINILGDPQIETSILNSGQIDTGQVSIYSVGYDNGIYGQPGQFHPVDFYTPSGSYVFDRTSALDGRRAFDNVYTRVPGIDRTGYSQLGSVQIITGYTTAPVASTSPPAPAQDVPAGPATLATPTPPFVPQPIYQTVDLHSIFQQSFIASYQKVAGYYYNSAYNDMLDDGTNAGYYVGQQVGPRLAFQQGFIGAFTSAFRQRESNAFYFGAGNMPGYQAAFASSFNSRYADYAGRAVLGVDSFSVAGVRDDGIVEPGEGIRASFVVRNYGGVDAIVPVSMEGDITGQSTASLSVPHLSTVRQSGTITANISPSVPSQSNANVILNVNGNRVPLAQYVTRQVVSTPATYTADFGRGIVSVSMALKNVSRVTSYDAVKFIVTDSLGRTQTMPIGMMSAGATWNVPVNLSGFDQLSLIDGQISVKVQALLGSVTIGSGTIVVSSSDRFNDLASAFEVVAQGTDSNMKTKVLNRLMTDIQNEAVNAARTTYDNSHASLLKALTDAKQSHPQTATTLAAYTSLANSLAPIENQMPMAAVRIWPFRRAHSENQNWFEAEMKILKGQQ